MVYTLLRERKMEIKKFGVADVRFNGGAGALLCNSCQIIVEYGWDHEDEEHYCESCSIENRD